MKQDSDIVNQYIRVPEVVRIRVARIATAPWNPRDISAADFQFLAENLEEHGLLENVVLVPLALALKDEALLPKEQEAFETERANNPEVEFVVISGNQRVRAMRVMDPAGVVNAVILDGESLAAYKFLTVRMNVIRGKFDPVKFAGLVAQMEEQYSRQAVQDMMMFADKNAFARLVDDVKKGLPRDLRKQESWMSEPIRSPPEKASLRG